MERNAEIDPKRHWDSAINGKLDRLGIEMSNDLKQNRWNAQAFYDLMFHQCQPREAIEKYAGEVYIQHNPEVGDKNEAFVEYFERMAAEYPGKKVQFKRSIAEANLVVLHCYQVWPGDHVVMTR